MAQVKTAWTLFISVYKAIFFQISSTTCERK